MTCPNDSSIRELLAEPLIAVDDIDKHLHLNSTINAEVNDEIFSQCCLNQKCKCKLCYIPDCHKEGEVVVELQSESIEMPGYCCGKYECQAEPNCTEVLNTESYYLTNCQRCKCYEGQRLCHQSCDTGIKTGICHSKSLNTFFEHGERWRDGCSNCECVNGEVRCMITFCKGLDCPKHRQVQLKNNCCPVCWPKGFPIPRDNNDYEDENEFDDRNNMDLDLDFNENEEDEIEPDVELKPLSDEYNSNATTAVNTTTSPTTGAKVTQTTIKIETTTKEDLSASTITATSLPPCKVEVSSTSTTTTPTPATAEPCNRKEIPATYQVYPQVVELMRYSQHNNVLYAIIGCLSVAVVSLAAWCIHLKAKQRSYRPVSNFDDNFNRMSSNIKKTNDYV